MGTNSLSIRQEIQRFESVHPSIYAIYDLIELIPDPLLAQQIREHVVCIEDSFVNSQEWTLSRGVPDLRLGIVGSLSSGKSALVHHYLTGSYMQEESPEGGRFKKEIVCGGQSYLLLIRDEGGPPELQFSAWVDAVIFVFSLENEASFNAIYNYYSKMLQFRNMKDLPLILVGTQDAICESRPRLIEEQRARKLAMDLKNCAYYETCATYGLNVERVFQDVCQKISVSRYPSTTPVSSSSPHLNSSALNSGSSKYTIMASNTSLEQLDINSHRGSRQFHKPQPPINHHQSPSGTIFDSSFMGPPLSTPNGAAAGTVSSGSGSEGRNFFPNLNQSVTGMSSQAQPQNQHQASSTQVAPAPETKELPTPNSTPTTSRKNRRRSNLFTPSKKLTEPPANSAGSLEMAPQMGSGRSIPIRQGYLYKKSSKSFSKDWKKKYVTLSDDGRLTYHNSLHDYMDNVHGKEISLQYVTVKVPGQKPRGTRTAPLAASANHSSNPSSNQNDVLGSTNFRSERKGEKVLLTGYEPLREPSGEENEAALGNNGSVAFETPISTNNKKRHRRIKTNGTKSNADCDGDPDAFEFHIVSLDNKQWLFEANSAEERDYWVGAIEQQILTSLQGNEINKTGGSGAGNAATAARGSAIDAIKQQVAGNTKCVDCNTPNPDWASINLGVLICIECSGVHRQLGSHISRVRSLDLDEWPPGHLAAMSSLGNHLANSVFDARLDPALKPSPTSPQADKEKYIVSKYERKDFLQPLPQSYNAAEFLVESIFRSDIRGVYHALAYASKDEVNVSLGPNDLRSPLHVIAATGDLATAQLLIWANADVNTFDHEGQTCLNYAKSSRNEDVIDLLLMNGAIESVSASNISRSISRNSMPPEKRTTTSVL